MQTYKKLHLRYIKKEEEKAMQVKEVYGIGTNLLMHNLG
jgi:hypothetical protein